MGAISGDLMPLHRRANKIALKRFYRCFMVKNSKRALSDANDAQIAEKRRADNAARQAKFAAAQAEAGRKRVSGCYANPIDHKKIKSFAGSLNATRDFCGRLSAMTGITFRICDETCEPVASGNVLTYWLTSYKDGFQLVASAAEGEYFSGFVDGEIELVGKINGIEKLFS